MQGTERRGSVPIVVVVFAARLVVVGVFGRRHRRPRRVPPNAPLLRPLLGAGLPTEDTANIGLV